MTVRRDSRECERWALSGFAVAFLELAISYILLCGSAVMALASKLVLVFGLHVPCPCSGILGYKNKDLCLNKLLFEWPLSKISMIQKQVRDRFPHDVVCRREQEEIPSSTVVSSDGKKRNNVQRIGSRKGSSSASGFRIRNQSDRENDSDVRTKQAMNQKQRFTARRRRGISSLVGETDETWEDSSYVKAVMHTDAGTVRRLEQALREERAARAVLAVELEEERAAAATAADEAMAMILRLQADKASLEMEAKQYERMMEEKFAYDEEQMIVLKEILVRREKENHFLEMELEAYKQIDDVADDESFCDAEEGVNQEAEAEMKSHENGSLSDKESIIYDVHVVEEDAEFHEIKTKEYEESVNSEDKEKARVKFMEAIINQLQDIVKDHDDVSSPLSSENLTKEVMFLKTSATDIDPSEHISKPNKEENQIVGVEIRH